MPRLDGTGPAGFGPATGRGLGYCTGYPVGYRRGFGNRPYMGFGGGRGYRNRFFATGLTGWQRSFPGWGAGYAQNIPYDPYYGQVEITREEQINILKDQTKYYEDALDGIKKQIKEMEGKED